jgi:iron complex transport system substrate-binding protein
VYFEEWDDPLISGIRWVDELIEVGGGDSIFAELRGAKLGRDRIVSAGDVIARRPDVIIASWCGKAVRTAKIAARQGWSDIPAVRDGHIYEIKSSYILQPGPAALTEGVHQLHRIVARVAQDIADERMRA